MKENNIQDYLSDIGKFVSISYKTGEGQVKYARGRLSVEGSFLVVSHNLVPGKIWRINLNEVTLVDYSSEPLEVRP